MKREVGIEQSKVQNGHHYLVRKTLFRELLNSLAALPQQFIIAYSYCFVLVFVASFMGFPKTLLLPGLFLGMLIIVLVETNRLASTAQNERGNRKTSLLVEVGMNMIHDVSTIAAILRQSTGLEENDIVWMSQVGSIHQIHPGEILIHERRRIDALYFVLSGRFEVSTNGRKGLILGDLASSNVPVSFLDRSQVIGEMSFIEEQNYLPSATVKAVSESIVWSISRTDLDNKIAEDPNFGVRFLKYISRTIATRLRSRNDLLVAGGKQTTWRGIFRHFLFHKRRSSNSYPMELNPGFALFMVDQTPTW